jgi:hypothetical protein
MIILEMWLIPFLILTVKAGVITQFDLISPASTGPVTFTSGSYSLIVEDDSSYVQFSATSSRTQSGMISISYLNCPQLTGPALSDASDKFLIRMDIYITKEYDLHYHTLSSISVYVKNATAGMEAFQWVVMWIPNGNNPTFFSGLFNAAGSLESGGRHTFSGMNIHGWQTFEFSFENTMVTSTVDTYKMKYYDSTGNFQLITLPTLWSGPFWPYGMNNIGCQTYYNFSKRFYMMGMLNYL